MKVCCVMCARSLFILMSVAICIYIYMCVCVCQDVCVGLDWSHCCACMLALRAPSAPIPSHLRRWNLAIINEMMEELHTNESSLCTVKST